MGTIRGIRWRKSSFSGDGDCVEVAATTSAAFLVRDSKLGDAGEVLSLSGPEWDALLGAVRAGLGFPGR
ncbi:DUF397 domain-containing protein [Actinomadura hibisca]|uniref:DUF397 domain-containing protein n=1 Tax=Actinomadura hibisca TaxID=68565 RepID=UPI000829FF93|nr:DUF397 domain-containing protein [Actinomadura hibisca]